MKQQAKRLFYITLQLKANNSFEQIIDGLRLSRAFVLQVSSYEYLNTVVMALLDLFDKTNSTYIRIQITNILLLSSSFIACLPSHPQIVTHLSQNLRSNDMLIRIQTLYLLEGLPTLFTKDTSVYHYLLSKLKWKSEMSTKQFLMIIRSLKKLLGISTFLAQIFAHNIRQLHELGEIDVKILVFLCSYSKFDSKNYQTIIESVWQLSELYVKKGNKPIKHYLGRLIVVSCIQNYMCIQLYFRKFRMHFPRLEQQITKIIFNYYNFLPLNILAQSSHSHLQNSKVCQNQYLPYNPTHQNLLDLCYEYLSIEQKISADLQKIITYRIVQDLNKQNLSYYTVLLSFYVSGSMRDNYRFDDRFAQKINHLVATNAKNDQSFDSRFVKWLKIALTTANYRMCSCLIHHILNGGNQFNVSAMMLFLCYTQLHLSPCAQKLATFLTVMQNLGLNGSHGKQHKLLELSVQWEKQYEKQLQDYQLSHLSAYKAQMQDGPKMQQQKPVRTGDIRKDDHIRKCEIKCEQQLQRTLKYYNFSERNNSNCSILLPPIIRNRPYQKIYFGKQTIIDIFKLI